MNIVIDMEPRNAATMLIGRYVNSIKKRIKQEQSIDDDTSVQGFFSASIKNETSPWQTGLSQSYPPNSVTTQFEVKLEPFLFNSADPHGSGRPLTPQLLDVKVKRGAAELPYSGPNSGTKQEYGRDCPLPTNLPTPPRGSEVGIKAETTTSDSTLCDRGAEEIKREDIGDHDACPSSQMYAKEIPIPVNLYRRKTKVMVNITSGETASSASEDVERISKMTRVASVSPIMTRLCTRSALGGVTTSTAVKAKLHDRRTRINQRKTGTRLRSGDHKSQEATLLDEFAAALGSGMQNVIPPTINPTEASARQQAVDRKKGKKLNRTKIHTVISNRFFKNFSKTKNKQTPQSQRYVRRKSRTHRKLSFTTSTALPVNPKLSSSSEISMDPSSSNIQISKIETAKVQPHELRRVLILATHNYGQNSIVTKTAKEDRYLVTSVMAISSNASDVVNPKKGEKAKTQQINKLWGLQRDILQNKISTPFNAEREICNKPEAHVTSSSREASTNSGVDKVSKVEQVRFPQTSTNSGNESETRHPRNTNPSPDDLNLPVRQVRTSSCETVENPSVHKINKPKKVKRRQKTKHAGQKFGSSQLRNSTPSNSEVNSFIIEEQQVLSGSFETSENLNSNNVEKSMTQQITKLSGQESGTPENRNWALLNFAPDNRNVISAPQITSDSLGTSESTGVHERIERISTKSFEAVESSDVREPRSKDAIVGQSEHAGRKVRVLQRWKSVPSNTAFDIPEGQVMISSREASEISDVVKPNKSDETESREQRKPVWFGTLRRQKSTARISMPDVQRIPLHILTMTCSHGTSEKANDVHLNSDNAASSQKPRSFEKLKTGKKLISPQINAVSAKTPEVISTSSQDDRPNAPGKAKRRLRTGQKLRSSPKQIATKSYTLEKLESSKIQLFSPLNSAPKYRETPDVSTSARDPSKISFNDPPNEHVKAKPRQTIVRTVQRLTSFTRQISTRLDATSLNHTIAEVDPTHAPDSSEIPNIGKVNQLEKVKPQQAIPRAGKTLRSSAKISTGFDPNEGHPITDVNTVNSRETFEINEAGTVQPRRKELNFGKPIRTNRKRNWAPLKISDVCNLQKAKPNQKRTTCGPKSGTDKRRNLTTLYNGPEKQYISLVVPASSHEPVEISDFGEVPNVREKDKPQQKRSKSEKTARLHKRGKSSLLHTTIVGHELPVIIWNASDDASENIAISTGKLDKAEEAREQQIKKRPRIGTRLKLSLDNPTSVIECEYCDNFETCKPGDSDQTKGEKIGKQSGIGQNMINPLNVAPRKTNLSMDIPTTRLACTDAGHLNVGKCNPGKSNDMKFRKREKRSGIEIQKRSYSTPLNATPDKQKTPLDILVTTSELPCNVTENFEFGKPGESRDTRLQNMRTYSRLRTHMRQMSAPSNAAPDKQKIPLDILITSSGPLRNDMLDVLKETGNVTTSAELPDNSVCASIDKNRKTRAQQTRVDQGSEQRRQCQEIRSCGNSTKKTSGGQTFETRRNGRMSFPLTTARDEIMSSVTATTASSHTAFNNGRPAVNENNEDKPTKTKLAITHSGEEWVTIPASTYDMKVSKNVAVVQRCVARNVQLGKCSFSNDKTTKKERFHKMREWKLDEKPFKCSLCSFQAQEEFHKPRSENHDGKVHGCPHCSYKTAKKTSLGQHMRSHAKRGQIEFPLDDVMLTRNSAVVRQEASAAAEKLYQCSECEYKTSWKRSMVCHMRRHTGERPFLCSQCEYRATSKQTMVTHLRRHTGEKPYRCLYCDYRCAQRTALVKHERAMHTKAKRSTSTGCCYATSSKTRPNQHRRMHTKEKTFRCSPCGSRSAQRSVCVYHTKTHTKIPAKYNQTQIQTAEKTYPCTTCDYKTKRKSNMDQHIMIHTGIKRHVCSHCGYKAALKRSIVIHMRTHTGNKPYTCTSCDYKCSQKGSLHRHMRIHTGEKPFHCSVCDYKAAHKTSLDRHMRKHVEETLCACKCAQKDGLCRHMGIHTDEKPLQCSIFENRAAHETSHDIHMKRHDVEKQKGSLCEYKCAQEGSLHRHMRIHTGEKPFHCSVCDYKAAHKTSLDRHMRKHVEETLCACKCAQKDGLCRHMGIHTDEKPLQCSIFENRAAHETSPDIHMKRHDVEKQKGSLCEYKCAQEGSLRRHLRIHTGKKPFQCSVCEYRAAYKTSLDLHTRNHCVEKLKCSLCEYKCAEKGSLRQHMRIHTGEKPFQCSVCEYRAAHKTSLDLHMRKHCVEKQKCSLCEYKCAEKGSLRRHMRIHTGEKPFQCSVCDYRTAHKQNCDRHMRKHAVEMQFTCSFSEFTSVSRNVVALHARIHTANKPYSCAQCEYETVRKGNLVQHMKSHSDEKPFPCSLCGYKAARKHNLDNHLRTHTGEKPYQCSSCHFRSAHYSSISRHTKKVHSDVCAVKPYECSSADYRPVTALLVQDL